MGPVLALIIIAGIVFVVVSVAINKYNKLVMLRNNTEKSFANIDVLLKQRADEVPNLIAVVKESQAYEESMLTQLTELRTRYLNASTADAKVEATNQLQKALKSLFAVAENYPDLKASKNLQTLQLRVSELEDSISDRREYFNESVNNYNIGISEFPELILARFMGYQRRHMLEISAEETAYDGVRF